MDTSLALGGGIEALPQFLTSLAIGLLIGLERERNPSAKAGLRTFTLVALFGTLMAMLSSKSGSSWMLAAGLLAVGAMIIAAYLNNPGGHDDSTFDERRHAPSLSSADERDKVSLRDRRVEEYDPGTTTVAALLLCYGLGALIWYGHTRLAVMLAIAITTLLYFKPELRGISQKLERRDLVSILQFCVLSFVILPILPDRSFGPYEAFNPYNAWLMVVLISGISLAGYIALHWTHHRYGVPLLGFLGGMVSSTATTLVYARHAKVSENMVRLSAVVILIASQVVLVRLAVVSLVVAPALLTKLSLAMGLGLLFGLIATVFDWRKLSVTSDLPIPKTSNPTEIHAALGFGLLYVIVLLCSAWLSDLAGSKGLYAVALASGLTDVDAITLSSLRLFNLGKLSDTQAVTAISLAFIANMAFKFGLVVFISGATLAKHIAVGFSAMAAGVALGLLLL